MQVHLIKTSITLSRAALRMSGLDAYFLTAEDAKYTQRTRSFTGLPAGRRRGRKAWFEITTEYTEERPACRQPGTEEKENSVLIAQY